jgi:heme/copper-type cytochrome/quinol oxidase subunit 2
MSDEFLMTQKFPVKKSKPCGYALFMSGIAVASLVILTMVILTAMEVLNPTTPVENVALWGGITSIALMTTLFILAYANLAACDHYGSVANMRNAIATQAGNRIGEAKIAAAERARYANLKFSEAAESTKQKFKENVASM